MVLAARASGEGEAKTPTLAATPSLHCQRRGPQSGHLICNCYPTYVYVWFICRARAPPSAFHHMGWRSFRLSTRPPALHACRREPDAHLDAQGLSL